jgi:arylsulfatase A-like enzyme
MFGKNHLTTMWETSPGGPFDRWPTGLGLQRFYGFMGGEASHWEPALFGSRRAQKKSRHGMSTRIAINLWRRG